MRRVGETFATVERVQTMQRTEFSPMRHERIRQTITTSVGDPKRALAADVNRRQGLAGSNRETATGCNVAAAPRVMCTHGTHAVAAGVSDSCERARRRAAPSATVCTKVRPFLVFSTTFIPKSSIINPLLSTVGQRCFATPMKCRRVCLHFLILNKCRRVCLHLLDSEQVSARLPTLPR